MKTILLYAALLISIKASADQTTYVSVSQPSVNRLEITTADGAVHLAPRDVDRVWEKNQAGFSKPKISADKRVIGWLSLYPNCCTSYPIPREIVLQKNGSVVAIIRGNGLPIWEWGFRGLSDQVALRQSPTHGPEPEHYELRDIETGKRLDQFDPAKQGSLAGAPQWALGLE